MPLRSAEKPRSVLIGLCGYAAAGKDTAARVLIDEFFFQRVAFADPIKAALLALDPFVPGPEKISTCAFPNSAKSAVGRK